MTPRPKRPREDMRAFRPCLACGMPVLTATDTDGRTLHLDVATPCYDVTWSETAALPMAVASRAYVLHQCQGACIPHPRGV